MLSYQHEYHAGNHADVLKHVTLVLLIRALQRKPGAIRVLDAHAGAGLYDLGSREARRRAEHRRGVARVLAAPDRPPALAPYVEAVGVCNDGGALRRYPGSPWLARALLRPQDQLVLMELHPKAFGALRAGFAGDPRVHLHRRDCFEGLPALVPPAERRGLVLVDPSYEVKAEFSRVPELLSACHGRWPTGVYLAWYPLLRERAGERVPGRVATLGIRRIFHLALEVEGKGSDGLRGSGLVVVNLPFGLESALREAAAWLWKTLAVAGRGSWKAEWLVGE